MCLARSSMSLVTLTSWISSKYSSAGHERDSTEGRPSREFSSAALASISKSKTNPHTAQRALKGHQRSHVGSLAKGSTTTVNGRGRKCYGGYLLLKEGYSTCVPLKEYSFC